MGDWGTIRGCMRHWGTIEGWIRDWGRKEKGLGYNGKILIQ